MNTELVKKVLRKKSSASFVKKKMKVCFASWTKRTASVTSDYVNARVNRVSTGKRVKGTARSVEKSVNYGPEKGELPEVGPACQKTVHISKRPRGSATDLTCELCSKQCRKPCELKVHMRAHMNIKPFSCSKCDKSFLTRSLMNKHIHDTHEGAHLRCRECGIRFDMKEELKEHCEQFGHTILWPFHCSKCDRSFKSKKSLKAHQLMHSGLKPFSCDLCSLTFITQSSLTRHSRTHLSDRPFKCADCGKSFVNHQLLKVHQMNHTGERPHLCEICGKGFKLPYQLQVHSQIHAEGKPHKCDTCGKDFKWRNSWYHHVKTHEDRGQRVPQFICSTCGKGYFYKSGLVYHQRMHADEKPFPCSQCPMRFRDNAHLKRHVLRVHAVNKSKPGGTLNNGT